MEWLFENILFLPFLTGLIFMVTAGIMYLFPPKRINHFYGYRTESSMKSMPRWDFAQRYSSLKMFQVGLVLFVLSFVASPFEIHEQLNLGIGLFLMLPGCIYMFWSTERALKKKFPNQ